jgi:uncharacterized membrane protein YhaH (DUF805 family)
MDWFLAALKDYARFSGRAHRREYASFVGVSMLLSIALGGIAGIVSVAASNPVGWLLFLMLLLPTVALNARRLHDLGLSAWWQLLSLIPGVGFLVLLGLLLWPARASAARFGPAPDDERVLGSGSG